MTGNAQLHQLYRDTVLRHSRSPHNFRRIEGPHACAEGHNPLCGDKVTVYLHLDQELIDDVAFEADGCAISLASASMLTDMVTGQTAADAMALTNDVQAMLEGGNVPQRDFGEMNALSGVRAYPSRVRCATLPWRTLQAALTGTARTVTTESKEQ